MSTAQPPVNAPESNAPAASTTSQALVRLASSQLAIDLGNEYGLEPGSMINTLISTVFPRSAVPPTVAQLAAFMAVARQYGLNPFLKQIYAFPTQGGGIVPMVPIDGWIQIVQRRKEYDGVEQKEHFDEKGKCVFVTTTMYRNDHTRPTTHTEYMAECWRDTSTWRQWPIRMLDWKSYIQTARMAFGLSGIYDEDEAERIAQGEPVKPSLAQQVAAAVIPAETVPAHESVAAAEAHENGAPPAGPVAPVPGQPAAPPAAAQGQGEDPEPSDTPAEGFIDKKKFRRMWALLRSTQAQNQGKPTETEFRAYLKEKHGIESTSKIPTDKYAEVCNYVSLGKTTIKQ